MHFQKLRNRNALTIITPTRREQTDLLLMPCALVCVDSSVPFLSHQYLHQLFCHYFFFVNPVQAVWAKNLLQQEMRISELVNTHRAKLLTPSMPPAKKKGVPRQWSNNTSLSLHRVRTNKSVSLPAIALSLFPN